MTPEGIEALGLFFMALTALTVPLVVAYRLIESL